MPWCCVGPVLALRWSFSGPVFLVVRASGASSVGLSSKRHGVFQGRISLGRSRDASPSDRAGESGLARQF